MKQLFRVLFTKRLYVAGYTALLLTNVHGQIPKDIDLTFEDVKKLNKELNLIANKINIKGQTLLIDSALLKREMQKEEEMMPADDLYDGEWNNEYVKAYTSISIPDFYKIDVSQFVIPFNGYVTSHFGVRRHRFHFGTDIKLQIGDTIVAAFDGKVRIKKDQGKRKGYGKYLVLRHPNGLETIYGHLSDYLVDFDETVKAGQPIGLGGNTGRSSGSHLHFEFRFLGMPVNPEEIVDFDNECTFDETYLFSKSKSEKYNYNYARKATYRQKAKTTAARKSSVTSPKTSTASSKTTNNTGVQSGRMVYHKIREGDTLGEIAMKYGTTISKLCRLNGVNTKTKLKIGSVLRCS
ncbi:MAG: peptidoglycan DD-metalloendopeptidase family protein [Dysgonamonadaceae bacterium]|jgi:murein DD-endopeptidase MepM/ murein hydrolase activator NlpD|nr:peptidoglycan DD-metalloendopeptidase family protein [Dysgonamonadaceae bacterium]